jgi:hypothetical protein
MGDASDTSRWKSVLPDTFESNMTFAYISFNVEDLHIVDEGVMIKHLFLLLEDPSKVFVFVVGHFLSVQVDHVGYRVVVRIEIDIHKTAASTPLLRRHDYLVG